jgi:hypothetical protein
MVINTEPNPLTVEEARRLRQQAGELLARLTAECEQSERRHSDAGKRDPMKFITGRTSLDNAVASVREMIVNMDQLLARLQIELEPAPQAPPRAPVRVHTRAHPRPVVRAFKPASMATATPGPDLQ